VTDYLRLAQQQAEQQAALDEPLPLQPKDDANPYLDLAQGLASREQERARFLIDTALKADPVRAAEIQRLKNTTGIPPDMIERNFEEVRRREAVSAINLVQIAKDSPVLARQLQDPNFTTVAVDDIGLLHDLGRVVQDTGVAALSGAVRLPQAVVGIADIATLGQAGKMLESVGYRPNEALDILNEFYSEGTQRALSRVQNADGFFNTLATALRNPSTVATTVIESLPSVIGGAAFARLITGVYGSVSPLLGAATGEGLMAAGAMAEDLRGDTPDGELNLRQALGSAAAGFGTAILGAAGGRIAGRLGLNDIDTALASGDLTGTATPGFAKQVLGQGLSEGVFEELPQSVQEQMWQNFANERPLFEGVGNAAAMGTLAGSATGAGFGAYSTAVAKIVGAAAQQADQIERADQDAKRLADALRIAQDSKLRERSPDQFRQLISQMTSDANLYVDGEVLAQLPPEVQAQLPATVQEQIQQAAAIGDVVTISQADALTVAPGTELEQVLVDNARTSPDAMSAVEAQQAAEQAQVFLQQEAERVIAQAEDQEAMRASSEAVRQSILGELNAAGRYRGSVNEAMSQWASAFYTTMASRVGMTPEEFYQRYRLRVLGEASAPAQADELIEQPGSANFDNWFGASKVVDDSGAPLVVYHGTVQQEGGSVINAFRTPSFFTPSPTFANQYASSYGRSEGGVVYPVYLSVQNPFRFGIDTFPFRDFWKTLSADRKQIFKDLAASTFDLNKATVADVEQMLTDSEWGANEDPEIIRFLQSFGYDGATITEDGVENWMAFSPEQIKSATGNRGTFDPNNPDILQQSATLRRGTETLKKYGLKPGQTYKTRDIAAALEARQREKYGTIAADDRSPEAVAKIAKWMQAEVEFAMDNPESSGVGWYSEKFQRALDTMAQVFPELATDKTARNTMTALIAITSDGQKVVPNFAQAMDIYGNFRESGKFETSRGHQRQASINANLEVVQRLHDTMGAEAMHEYLMQEKTISELKKIAKANGGEMKSDYQAHIKMPMAAVEFGPKLGAFYANLMGAHGYLTMDRWWSRTFNRYRGTLLQAPTRQGLDRFKELMVASLPEYANMSASMISDDEVLSAVVAPRNAYEAKGFKNGTEIEKAANTIYKKAFENLEDAPFNATDRTFMLDAVNKAQQSLKRKGYNLSVADIQAILWYYEKRLYGELGARQTADISYEEAAQRVASRYASGQGIESLLDDTAAAPEDGGAGEGGVPVGEELFQGGVDGGSQQARDGAGREAGTGPTPLPGAPVVEGATGPDPRLVAVAEQYARDNGIDLRRQGRYAKVDRERAARIAAAYEAMAHDPQNPQVKEAYENLIRQTVAQYRALEAAGYKFWFIDPTNDPYTSPWDAMRDMRSTQTMGVFPTIAGFGSGATDVDVTDNPLMVDTGILWPYGSPDGELKPVLANDLFRAVHDAFGHGLEGAGFRAQGEENAWQAHIRLFTGSAVGAVTSETRGQNSWLNFGPYGETNRTAKVEDTVFADQKTGLMPEWTWNEGRVEDMPEQPLQQGPRGTFNPRTLELVLNPNADLSTWFHETGHFFLEVMADVASQPDAPAQIVEDMNAFLQWAGIPDLATWNGYSLEQKRPYHERWAESIEQYVMEGRAPSVELQPLMRRFSAWLKNVYGSIKLFLAQRGVAPAGGQTLGQSRIGMNFRDVIKRTPELQAAADKVRNGEMTAAQYEALVDQYKPVEPYTEVPPPASSEDMQRALTSDKTERIGVPSATLEAGHPVGLRLDIPAYANHGVWVVSVHEQQTGYNAGKSIGYESVASATDVTFGVVEKAAMNIASGKPKATIAVMKGGWKPTTPEQAKATADAALNDPAWVQVGMDPERHSYFYDRATMDPIVAADEVIQIGPLVLAKNPRYGDKQDFLFQGDQPAGADMQLNDDIRRVMDRMLATDEQIQQANAVAGLAPDEQADGEAMERLQRRSMADLKWAVNARDKAIRKLQRETREIEKQVRAEVAAEVDATPEMRARAALLQLRKDKNTNELTKAAVADAFGYESVDAMNAAIEAFGKRADVINERTELRMLNEYGDLVDERAIQEAANEAVHNEARARSLASELRSQQEMINQRRDTGRTNARGARITVSALLEAGRQFGANVVARTPIGKLRGVAWRHTSAERRAGTRWRDATMKGETAEAVQAQRDRFLNNAAAKAAVEAQAEVRKFLEFFKRVNRGNNEKVVERGRNPDIVNAARAILSAYGMQSAASKNAAAYLELVKKNDPELYATIEPIVQQALVNSKPIDELTFDEIVGLHESIQSLWFLSKRSRQMEVDGKLVDIDDSAQELFARMEEIGIPDRIAGEGMAVTKEEERGLFLKQGIAFLRRVEQWAEGMDGRYGGPFLRLVFQPIKDAADRYRKDRLEYRKKFQALVDNLAPIVGDSVIQAPELLYTFGTPGSTAGTAMNEILHAIAHTGNESNKRKLLLGRGWATENEDGTLDTSRWDSFIQRLINEGKLVEAHFDFVQGVWDLLEETKTLAQKAHRDAFGRYFNEVTANEFVDPFGVTRRGGYIPAQVDSRLVKDNALRRLAEEENQSMAFAFPQPAKGFTMSRVEYNRPLMLDLRSLSQHIDKVLLFSHMTVPARDVRKLLMRSTVSQPLSRIEPAALESMLQPWLQRSAQQIVETPIVGTGRWARIPGIVRSRAGMALMFGNVSNAIQQITGLSTAAVRVKPSFLMRSLSQYVSNPREFSRAVWDASPYMNDRATNEVSVLNEQMEAILIRPTTYERVQDWSLRHAYFLQTALDNVLSPIVWTGAYNQALAEGMSDKDAVRFADSTVRQTQGSTLPEDVSRIETGPAYARAFTQFVGYFNMMANTNATAFKQLMGEVGLKKGAGKALYIVMMGLMAPIWVAEAIALAMRGGPEDDDDDGYLDDWLAQVFGMGTAKGLLAQIPIAGQFGVAAANRFNDDPLDDRVSLSPAISLLESAVGAPQSVYKAIVEDGSSQKAIRDVATLVSVATGVPLYGVSRPIGYTAGVIEGRIEPQGPIDVMRGLVTGTASPESKAQ
jgi:hypothetical protein